MKDLEFNNKLSKNNKLITEFYNKHNKHIHLFIVCALILTIAIRVKSALNNIDYVIESATAITLDESQYVPFKWSETMISDVESKDVKVFPIKDSHINWKMQSLNIIQARNHITEYITSGGYECIHARHFDIPYDIIVFKNMTMVNPKVEKQSDTMRYLDEITLDGEVIVRKRPVSIDVVFLDEALDRKFTTLYDDQAACFAHYNFRE